MNIETVLTKETISSILFDLNAVNQAMLLISETHPIYDDLLGLLIGRMDDCIEKLELLA